MIDSAFLLISITIIYSYYYYRKEKEYYLFLPALLLSIIIKYYIFILGSGNLFHNSLTHRDETTFLVESSKITVDYFSHISAGDIFLTSAGSFFLNLFGEKIILVRLIPTLSTIIVFHYICKIVKFFKYSSLDQFIIINLTLLLPSYIFFHNSFTKEFLQLIFFIPAIYYALKILNNFSILTLYKLIFSLILFSMSHRGFEIASFAILVIIIFFKILYYFNIKKILRSLIICIFFALSYFILYYIVLEFPFVQKTLIDNQFSLLLQEIRYYNSQDENNYHITLNFDNTINSTMTIFKLFVYYLFYFRDIFIIKNFYYFLEIILLYLTFIFFIFSLFNIKDYFMSSNKKYINQYIFLFICFIFINFGFSIFTSNFANALRHKTITNFIIFLYLPFIRIYLLNYFYSFNKKFN